MIMYDSASDCDPFLFVVWCGVVCELILKILNDR